MINFQPLFKFLLFKTIALLFLCNALLVAAKPMARQGILDAKDFLLDETGYIYLDGEWEFYPHQLLFPSDFSESRPFNTSIVPDIWEKDSLGNKIEFATYRLRITNHSLPPVFSIRNHEIFSAFVLFLNGVEILRNGTVAMEKENEVPGYIPKTASLYSLADTIELVLQVSNHHYYKGGISESLIIGRASALHRNQLMGSGFEFFIMGSLLIMAIYYLSLFIVLKKNNSSLYFSIFIFLAILRILVTGQRLLLVLFPEISWNVVMRLEYGTLYLTPVFFILFFNSVFREEIKIYVVNIVIAISSIFFLIAITTTLKFFSGAVIYYQPFLFILGLSLVIWLWKARANNKEGALVLMVGLLILFSSMLYDLAFSRGSFRGSEMFPAGVFLFILCQSYILSIKFSSINKENQLLWEELDYKNQHLGQMVIERTSELEQQKNLLEQTNSELEQKKRTTENQSHLLEGINELLEKEKEKTDQLLLNVLPQNIANELKAYGKCMAHSYPLVTVLFIDFVQFSDISEHLTPDNLIRELHSYFAGFDEIAKKYNLEKIKTIGDAYMCAGGLHEDAGPEDVINTVKAALEMSLFVSAQKDDRIVMGDIWFDCRIGLHTGPVIAGVVGKTKFAFDLWGGTVNIAKRMEATCEPGQVNISESTYQYVSDAFTCQSRGKVATKHNKNMRMFYVEY